MIPRALSASAALLLFAFAPAVSARDEGGSEAPFKETMPTWYVVKSDGRTSAPVIDASSGALMGFLPRGAEILTFGNNGSHVMISVNRRSAFVPVDALTPKYPLPPEKPEFIISPGGLEKNIARARETAKARREDGLAPRVMATPFGYVPKSTPGAGGAAGRVGGAAGRSGGGDGI
jgi:hypothetical protein